MPSRKSAKQREFQAKAALAVGAPLTALSGRASSTSVSREAGPVLAPLGFAEGSTAIDTRLPSEAQPLPWPERPSASLAEVLSELGKPVASFAECFPSLESPWRALPSAFRAWKARGEPCRALSELGKPVASLAERFPSPESPWRALPSAFRAWKARGEPCRALSGLGKTWASLAERCPSPESPAQPGGGCYLRRCEGETWREVCSSWLC
jgi:hypothetical protein